MTPPADHSPKASTYSAASRTYAPVPYEANPAKRLAWQAAYSARQARPRPVNKAHYHATREVYPTYWPDAMPPGPYVGHCGQWIAITCLPLECPTCHDLLFTEEKMPRGAA